MALPVALLSAVLLIAGCSDPVAGAGIGGIVAGEGSGTPALPEVATVALQAIAASADTKQSVVVIDTPVLNGIAARQGYPAADDDGGDPAGRSRSESAYLELNPVREPCRSLDESFAPLRTAPAGPSITVGSRTDGKDGTVSRCAGPADLALLRKNFAGGDGEPTTVDGVEGLLAGDTFIGIDTAADATLIRDGEPRSAVVSQLVGGTAVQGSLWQDPDVVAVLSQLPGAAVAVLGTDMVQVPRGLAPPAVSAALATVVERTGFGQPPVPEFGGFGWIPGDRLVGTSVFVTLYGSDQEAATATSILTAVWAELGTSKYTGAVTRQLGPTVVTSLAGTTSTEFMLQDLRLAEYPGFLDRG
ncbi:MAG: hypothetical protein WKF57_11240 [Nakamurella sp.]